MGKAKDELAAIREMIYEHLRLEARYVDTTSEVKELVSGLITDLGHYKDRLRYVDGLLQKIQDGL